MYLPPITALSSPSNSSEPDLKEEQSSGAALINRISSSMRSFLDLTDKEAARYSDDISEDIHLLYSRAFNSYNNQDYSKAAFLFKLAAALGHPKAPFRLGSLFKNGEGVETDLRKAAEFYQKGELAGDKDEAGFELGIFYMFGNEVPVDAAKVNQFTKADINFVY